MGNLTYGPTLGDICDAWMECDEIVENKNGWKEKENEIITLDEAREHILETNPSWCDGGETMTVIDNVAYAFLVEHNNRVTEKAEMELRQSLLQPRSIKEIPLKVRDSLEDHSIDMKEMLRMRPRDMFIYYWEKYNKETTPNEIYDIVVALYKMEGR